MLTYKKRAGFVTVTIEPDDEFWYYIVDDLETKERFVIRRHITNPNIIDCWCPIEWHNGFELDKMKNVENLYWVMVTKKYTYTLPTKEACLKYSHN